MRRAWRALLKLWGVIAYSPDTPLYIWALVLANILLWAPS